MAQASANIKPDPSSIQTIVEMGFTEEQAKSALVKYNNNLETALNQLLIEGDTTENDPAVKEAMAESLKYEPGADLGVDMDQAIANSLQDMAGQDLTSFDPLNPMATQRMEGIPVGLKNVGNTCYFNSIIQSYQMMPNFVTELMKFVPHPSHFESNEDISKKKQNLTIVKELQLLFGFLMRSNRKYIDPSRFLRNLVDDFGCPISIGEQRDVGEFLVNLINRIEEGLNLSMPYRPPEPEEEEKQEEHAQPRVIERKYSQIAKENQKISYMFFGKQLELLSYTEPTGQSDQLQQKVVFHQIIVNPEERELVFGWDSSCYDSCEYKTPNGYDTTAQQETWIDEPPSVLSFQVNRVQYDAATGTGKKIHSPFTFKDRIYIDRFLFTNRERVQPLREQEQLLKSRVKALETAIAAYENYKDSGKSLTFHIDTTIDLLLSQSGRQQTPSPSNIVNWDIQTAKDIQTSVETLKKYKDQITQQLDDMNGQLAAIRQEIDAVFDFPDLKRHMYNLHSILVHDGHAEGGHYYAYIFNHIDRKWRKYSDMLITEVDESDVFRNSIGGEGWASAYYLFYIDLNRIGSDDLYNGFHLIEEGGLAAEWIPTELQSEIMEDNARLKNEHIDAEMTKIYKQISDLYAYRNEQCMNYINSEACQPDLWNFPMHLLKNKDYTKVNLGRWVLLDICVRETTEDHKGMDELAPDDPLLFKLKNQFIPVEKEAPRAITLSPKESEVLQKELKAFSDKFEGYSVLIYSYEQLRLGNFVNAFIAIGCIINQGRGESDYATSFARGVNRIICLKTCKEIKNKLENQQELEAIELMKLLTSFSNFYLIRNDLTVHQIHQNMQSCINWAYTNLQDESIWENMNAIFRSLEKEELLGDFDVSQIPAELQQIVDAVREKNLYSWMPGWETDQLGYQYMSAYRRHVENEKLYFLINTHLSKNRQILNESQLASLERNYHNIQQKFPLS